MKKTKNEPKPVSSLKEILGILETPLTVEFNLNEQPCRLEVRRAMSSVMERRREILRAPQPPWVKERNSYDDLNPQYMQRRDEAILTARALTVYLCCPEVAALKPGLVTPEQIRSAVKDLLPENIQELIELTACAGGLDVEVTRRANFMSAAPLEA